MGEKVVCRVVIAASAQKEESICQQKEKVAKRLEKPSG